VSLSDLANIGEFVGGIAVIATLVHLAIQIRQNTRSVRSATFQSVVDSFTDYTFELSKDAELTRLYLHGLNEPNELSEQDSQRFHFLMLTIIRRFESAFQQQSSMMLTPSQWSGFRGSAAGVLSSPGGGKWWVANRALFTEEFQNFVESASI
jgi:hypothetical protein